MFGGRPVPTRRFAWVPSCSPLHTMCNSPTTFAGQHACSILCTQQEATKHEPPALPSRTSGKQ